MSKILGIDYGIKRVGIAVTDSTQTIATGIDTVHSKDIIEYIKGYCRREDVECIVIGEPKTMKNKHSDTEVFIESFIKKLKAILPNLKIERCDERFTSKLAFQALIDGGAKQKKRKEKALIDKISATIILQTYLEKIKK